jgi:hypothetical protein
MSIHTHACLYNHPHSLFFFFFVVHFFFNTSFSFLFCTFSLFFSKKKVFAFINQIGSQLGGEFKNESVESSEGTSDQQLHQSNDDDDQGQNESEAQP